jgi:hypothetical protein
LTLPFLTNLQKNLALFPNQKFNVPRGQGTLNFCKEKRLEIMRFMKLFLPEFERETH